MPSVFIVDDDPEYGDLLEAVLSKSGFGASLFASPGKLFEALLHRTPDAFVVDMVLPTMTGADVIRAIRSSPVTRGCVIIAVSALERESKDVVRGFRAGADEYLLKPVDAELLAVRLRSLLARRGGADPDEIVKTGPLAVNLTQRSCALGGKGVVLTRREFDLLVYFLRNPNRVMTRAILLESVWVDLPGVDRRTVDKHVERLRRKLAPFGKRIETAVDIGYRLRV
jgi:DNA-binding response OmpR family regulator